MNQTEIKEFFDWAQENVANARWEDCEESQHFYWNDTYLGGWAGDTCQFFYKQSDDLAKLLRMMDAFNNG